MPIKKIKAQESSINSESKMLELLQVIGSRYKNKQRIHFAYDWNQTTMSELPTNFNAQISDTVKVFSNPSKYVGIAKLESRQFMDSKYTFLCSESFGPCVPVIGFTENYCFLDHTNGLGACQRVPEELNNLQDGNGKAKIVIIQKPAHDPKLIKDLSNGLKSSCHKRTIHLCKLSEKALGDLGVVISLRSREILVYVSRKPSWREKHTGQDPES